MVKSFAQVIPLMVRPPALRTPERRTASLTGGPSAARPGWGDVFTPAQSIAPALQPPPGTRSRPKLRNVDNGGMCGKQGDLAGRQRQPSGTRPLQAASLLSPPSTTVSLPLIPKIFDNPADRGYQGSVAPTPAAPAGGGLWCWVDNYRTSTTLEQHRTVVTARYRYFISYTCPPLH